jgi:hypothetical protein
VLRRLAHRPTGAAVPLHAGTPAGSQNAMIETFAYQSDLEEETIRLFGDEAVRPLGFGPPNGLTAQGPNSGPPDAPYPVPRDQRRRTH